MHSLPKRKYLIDVVRPKCPSAYCRDVLSATHFVWVVRFGYFKRKWNGKYVQRYKCRICNSTFSDATFSESYRQHKPYLNSQMLKWYASCGSQRRATEFFKINLKTSARKLKFLGESAALSNEEARLNLIRKGLISDLQFDEMESTEHTKLKPLSIPLMVETKSRKIIGFEVCVMPAKGLLAEKSRAKYGHRKDEREKAIRTLLNRVSNSIDPKAYILTDSKSQYGALIKEIYPNVKHTQVISRAGSVTGQGELKKIGYDPIFSLNHTAAMLRANVNRLFRKTWCTTKKPESLRHHLEIYRKYHNEVLIHRKQGKLTTPDHSSAARN